MKLKSIALFSLLVIIVSCKKNDSTTNPPKNDTYLTTSSGSSWNYHSIDNSGAVPPSDYTLTATANDTSIGGRTYHIFINSAGGNQYMTTTSHDYYQFDSLPAGVGNAVIDRLYLKDNLAVGGTWSQSVNVNIPGSFIPIPFTVSNSIAESGISKTVNGTVYTDVIHVTSQISSSFIPSASLTSSIDTWYAKKYGMIENTSQVHLDFAGIVQDVNTAIMLTSATLK